MRPLIFGLLWLWFFLFKIEAKLENEDEKMSSIHKYQALIFNLRLGKLSDIKYFSNSSKRHHYFTACPASTPEQIKFNKDFSITGKSLFLKKVHHELDLQENICEKPVESVEVYDTKRQEYLIGYELCSEDGTVNLKSNNGYKHLRMVNMKNKMIHLKKQISSNITKYQDIEHTKVYFNDGSPTLVFHWIPVFVIQHWHPNTKQINFGKIQNENVIADSMHRIEECKNYNADDKNLEMMYSEENQARSLAGILPLPEKNSEISCGQIYGCLEESQIIPLWYYNSSWEKLASCSNTNTIPVWKSISNQLRKVDRLIFALSHSFKLPGYDYAYDTELIFGTSDVLRMEMTGSLNQREEVHLWNPKHKQNISIPGIIFRIFKYASSDESSLIQRQGVFIIHNNPAAELHHKLCTEQGEFGQLSSWSSITNDNPRTGLTYVCTATKQLYYDLGVESELFITQRYDLKYLSHL